jgi:hypothetical protein
VLSPAAALVAVAGMVALGVGTASPGAARDQKGAVVVADDRLTESSALAVSPHDPDLLYTVNDSGNDPVVYVVDRSGGAESQVVGTTALAGADRPTLDPEALAVGADDTLWVADIGDNEANRNDIALYALPAPGRGDATVTPVRYPLAYPGDEQDDAETLVADPATGAMWVVTKALLGGSVFAVPANLATDRPNLLRKMPSGRIPLLVTDGTVLPGGDAAVLRTYVEAQVYTLPGWDPVGAFPLPSQAQGESLTALDGRQLLAGTEGSPARIDLVEVPGRLAAALQEAEDESEDSEGAGDDGTVAPTTGLPGGDGAAAGDDGAPSGLVLGLGGAVVGVGAVLALVWRRRR